MAIDWEVLIAEMTMLGAIIYSAIFVENWVERNKLRRKEKEDARRIIEFVTDDLNKRLRFIEDSVRYKDFKPFFTDMWDAIILGGKQTVLPFRLFENLQHTYSWMKYYNNELEQKQKAQDEAGVAEVLGEVKGSINQSLKLLKEIEV
jgi:hypothetical protein